jgi:hypothetical protein
LPYIHDVTHFPPIDRRNQHGEGREVDQLSPMALAAQSMQAEDPGANAATL